MKLKAEKIVEIWNVINKLGEKESLPLDTAIKIADNIDSIQKAIETIGERDFKIAEKYAIKDENGEIQYDNKGQFQVDTKNTKKFVDERKELYETEVDVRFIFLGKDDLRDSGISAKEYIALKPLLKKEK